MAKVTFDNLTPEQAQTFADWFSGQGEQDCSPWFDAREVEQPYSGKSETDDEGNITVFCKTY